MAISTDDHCTHGSARAAATSAGLQFGSVAAWRGAALPCADLSARSGIASCKTPRYLHFRAQSSSTTCAESSMESATSIGLAPWCFAVLVELVPRLIAMFHIGAIAGLGLAAGVLSAFILPLVWIPAVNLIGPTFFALESLTDSEGWFPQHGPRTKARGLATATRQRDPSDI